MSIDLNDRAWFDAIPVGGIGVHVVEGVWHQCSCGPFAGDKKHTHHCPDNGYRLVWRTNAPLHPTPEWVALSEQKCETCATEGEPDDYEDGWELWFSEDDERAVQIQVDGGLRMVGGEPDWNMQLCPVCLGSGRPLVQVTVPCESCDGDGWLMGHDESVHPDARVDTNVEQVDCLDCDALGCVSIGSVTVESVVPIFDRCPDYSPADHICVAWGDGWYWHRDGRTDTEIPLGQDLEQYVGKFGVIVRRVS